MAKISFEIVKDDAIKRLDEMVTRGKDMRSFIKRVIYPIYQDMQMRRWMSEGASEGTPWKPVNPKYAAYKKRRYGGGIRYKWVGGRGDGRPWVESGSWPVYPGQGTKLLIATGRLAGSVIGPDKGFPNNGEQRVIVGQNFLFVGTSVPYAREVDQVRPIFRPSQASLGKMRSAYKSYMEGRK